MVGMIGAMEEEVREADRGYDRMRDAGKGIHEIL